MKKLPASLTLAFVVVLTPPASGSSIHVDGECRLTDKGVVLTGLATTDHRADLGWNPASVVRWSRSESIDTRADRTESSHPPSTTWSACLLRA